jgi:hypothetical protein
MKFFLPCHKSHTTTWSVPIGNKELRIGVLTLSPVIPLSTLIALNRAEFIHWKLLACFLISFENFLQKSSVIQEILVTLLRQVVPRIYIHSIDFKL